MKTKLNSSVPTFLRTWSGRVPAAIAVRLALVVMLGVVVVGPAGTVAAQSVPGTVALLPNTGAPGQTVTVTFTVAPTFQACILIAPPPVYVVWDNGLVLAQVTSRTSVCDSFTSSIVIPPNAPPGPHTITVRDGNPIAGPVLAVAPFIVGGIGVGVGTPDFNGLVPPVLAAPPILAPPPPPFPPFDPRRYMRIPLRLAFGIDVPVITNRAPSCAIEGPSTGRVGENLTFRSAAADRDGTLTEQEWRITQEGVTWDRIIERGDSVTFAPRSAGVYEIRLNIEDSDQAVNSCGAVLTVTA